MASKVFYYWLRINDNITGIGIEVTVEGAINGVLEELVALGSPMDDKIGGFMGLVWDENGMLRAVMERHDGEDG